MIDDARHNQSPDNQDRLACLACCAVHPLTRPPLMGRWIRNDVYESLGVCRDCAAYAGDWDIGRIDPVQVQRALRSLGRDISDGEARKIAVRVSDRILWFASSRPKAPTP